MTQVHGAGPVPAPFMVVGDSPGDNDLRTLTPFSGGNGKILHSALQDAGILHSQCFFTNLVREGIPDNDLSKWVHRKKRTPPSGFVRFREGWTDPRIAEGWELLKKEIEAVQPQVIIALGNLPLWALTSEWGITDWRGSELTAESPRPIPVVASLPPFHIVRQWSLRGAFVTDLKRAERIRREGSSRPDWEFDLQPNLENTVRILAKYLSALDTQPYKVSFDLETRFGHIACAGLSLDGKQAICIPFMQSGKPWGYWEPYEESAIVFLLWKILTHENARVIGQNLLYDSQYTYRHWHFVPRVWQDTMISHHTAFVELPKALDFQASLYCKSYRFWKNDGKEWSAKMDETLLWRYNCEDVVRTYEVCEGTRGTIQKLDLQPVHDFQQALFWPVLQAMQRGVRIDTKARAEFALELSEEISKRQSWLERILGHPFNPRSPKQMQALFYGDLNQRTVISRKTGRPSLDDDAMSRLESRETLLRPLIKCIRELRSLGVFLSTFVNAPLDHDGRMRCSYNICGTMTFRFSSSENAFGSGTNLQNLPKGTEVKDPDELSLPNVRKLFIPDPGYTFFDMDLDRADLQVVVWEADDTELKAMLREGVDIHSENAKTLGVTRQLAKAWVHGTNYGGSPRTMAQNCGITVKQAEMMRSRWMQAHPGILKWHERTEQQLFQRRYIENILGYRWYVLDRPDGLLPEALAWVPQSTVACVINRAWVNIYKNLPEAQVLLQVHDSLAGQYPTHLELNLKPQLLTLARIPLPYSDPLTIPVGLKTSTVSWGHCD